MPFWSKDKDPKPLDPEKYFPRAQRRMALVGQESDRLVRLLCQERLNSRALKYISTRLRELAEEQRNEIVSLELLDEHKRAYFQIMDIQARKAEDLLATGGENLEALIAEEQELQREANVQQRSNEQRLKSRYGIAMPDFSDPS